MFSLSLIVGGSFFILLNYYYQAQKRLVIDSYLDLERAIVERTAATAERWFRSRMAEASVTEIEDEIFRYFVDPIRVLRSGDAWIYNRDYVIYDKSSDFPEEYRGKPIDAIFRIQDKLGASHYDELVSGVLGASQGQGWYIWLPDKGREWAVWRSFAIGGRTWTLGLSTPENEIYEYYGVRNMVRSGFVYCCAVTLVCLICAAFLTSWFRRNLSLARELDEAKSEAENANRAKSDFLAVMSHEIRTPMNSILGFLELLSMGSLSGEQREQLSIITTNAHSLLAIINDILDFSKIEKGKLELDAVPFDPIESISRVVKLFEMKAAEKKLRLSFMHDASSLSCVGDPLRFGQVVVNLVGNAVKFTPEGGCVEVELTAFSRGGEARLRVEVSDTGIGIPLEQQGQIFEAFEQGDSSVARRYGGTGLGLSISARIVQLMGGALRVESEPGRGSRFYFVVDLPVSEHEPIHEPAVPMIGIPGHATAPRKALIAEDTRDSLALLSHMLKKLGISADAATNGEDAVALFRRNRYDAVILDGQMPGMDGVEAARRIRDYEKENGLPRTLIIALSARILPEERSAFLSAGADAFVAKPLSMGTLSDALRGVSSDGEPNQAPSGARCIDLSLLRSRLSGDEAVIREMLTFFVKDYADRRRTFEAALESRDVAALGDAAHALKGSALSLCDRLLADSAGALEAACQDASRNSSAAESLYASLANRVEALTALLAESVDEAKALLESYRQTPSTSSP